MQTFIALANGFPHVAGPALDTVRECDRAREMHVRKRHCFRMARLRATLCARE